MRISLQQLLRAEKIMFASNFFSQNPSTKGEICEQLKNYRYFDKVGAVQNKKFLTGKIRFFFIPDRATTFCGQRAAACETFS